MREIAEVVFDIEVVPDLPINELKEHVKRIEGDEDLTEQFAKDFIFNHLKNKIVSISMLILVPNEKPQPYICFSTTDEESVVNEFYDCLKELKEANLDILFVGFNINGFDLPLFKTKASKYISKEKRENLFDLKPWETFDIFDKLGRKGKLVDHLEFQNIEPKYNGLTGSDFLNLYILNDEDSMRKYSMQDAISEAKLYNKVKGI